MARAARQTAWARATARARSMPFASIFSVAAAPRAGDGVLPHPGGGVDRRRPDADDAVHPVPARRVRGRGLAIHLCQPQLRGRHDRPRLQRRDRVPAVRRRPVQQPAREQHLRCACVTTGGSGHQSPVPVVYAIFVTISVFFAAIARMCGWHPAMCLSAAGPSAAVLACACGWPSAAGCGGLAGAPAHRRTRRWALSTPDS